jgi:hypothetical protein
MKIVGKDGVQVGTVDKVEEDRIKLTKKDSPEGHEHHRKRRSQATALMS